MKRAVVISLALNVLLLGWVTWYALTSTSPKAHAGREWPRTNLVVKAKCQVTPAPNEPLLPVVAVDESFIWAQVESTDYRVYLANLRALGCPEPTVRDIIVADVNDLFSARVRAVVEEVSGRFWSLLLHKSDTEQMVDEKEKQLRALREERDDLFKALFGDRNPRSEEDQQESEEARQRHWAEIADFLPEEKQARYTADRAQLESELAEVAHTPGLTGVQQQAKRRELENAHEQALRQWLTPDEFEELRLRQSSVAGLRDRLPGLDLSDGEVRAVAKIRLTAQESKAAQTPAQTDAQLSELLGPERSAALQRASDERYANLQRVAQRLDLPETTTVKAYDFRRSAEDAARQVQSNKTLSPEERSLVLQAIADETRRGISDALGLQAFTAYERFDGGWLKSLTDRAR
jgi:hypothetical protein